VQRLSSLAIAACLIAILAACGDDGEPAVEAAPLVITRTFPGDKGTDVNLNPLIEIWFDRALDEASVTTGAVQVEGAETRRLEYNDAEHSIRLYLGNILEPDSTYRVIIRRSISNTEGDTMQSDASFEFTTGPLDCEHLEDYFEPNDDIQSAPEIELGRRYTCLSSCGGQERVDFYRFTVENAVQISADAYHSFSDTDPVEFKVNFLRQDGEYYWETASALSPNEAVSNDFTFYPGTYLAELAKRFDDKALLVYDLRLKTGIPCEDDPYEDNDFPDEATPVTPGLLENLTGCINDRDYFSIHLYAGQTLTAVATQVTDLETGRKLCIHKPDGSEAACTSFVALRMPISRSWTASEGGTHYVKVLWKWSGVKYNLHISVIN
jgi:hypothetical protein